MTEIVCKYNERDVVYSVGDVLRIHSNVNVYLELQNFSSTVIFYQYPQRLLKKGDIIVLLNEDQQGNIRVLSRLGTVYMWKMAITSFCSL